MAGSSLSFDDWIQSTLTFTLQSGTYSVPGANIKSLDLRLKYWGFSGDITFLVMCNQVADGLNSSFIGNTLIKVALSVQVANAGSMTQSLVPITLNGIVSCKEYTEYSNISANTSGNFIAYRLYSCTFVDPAYYYWSQHYLINLYVNGTFSSIINAQVNSDIKLSLNWSFLTTSQAQILVSAGVNGKDNASFYDFLLWLVDQNNGYFYYNYSTQEYCIVGALPAATTTVICNSVPIKNYKILLPKVQRATLTLMNSNAQSPKTQTVTNANAATPIVRDVVVNTPTASVFTNAVQLETDTYFQSLPSIEWCYKELPIVLMMPGTVAAFTTPDWSTGAYLQGKSFSIKEVRLTAFSNVEDVTLSNGGTYAGFTVTLTMTGQAGAVSRPMLPDYAWPTYPIEIEGIVYSDQGEATSATYAYVTNSTTSLNYYQVQIPLWQNLIVSVPYQPSNLNGQFYFPPYKGQQVMLSIGLYDSNIISYLDWRTYSILPTTGQGNQLVFGQSSTSMTSINHTYSGSTPQFNINRVLGEDTEIITLGEGCIILQTKENS
jgi:hypothetical protein